MCLGGTPVNTRRSFPDACRFRKHGCCALLITLMLRYAFQIHAFSYCTAPEKTYLNVSVIAEAAVFRTREEETAVRKAAGGTSRVHFSQDP